MIMMNTGIGTVNLAGWVCVLIMLVDHGVPDGDDDGVAVPRSAVRAQPLDARGTHRVPSVAVSANLHDFRPDLRRVKFRAICGRNT